MNFVPCLTWVPRGVAKSMPYKLKLFPEELKNLIEETNIEVDECMQDDDEEEAEETSDCDIVSAKEIDVSDDDKDFDARYDLSNYDDEGRDDPIFNMAGLTVYADNKDDEHITIQDEEDEDEIEEQEDFTIKETDNLLVVGHIEGDSSVMEIHVYNNEDESFYVHHDIVLPAYPLALEWLDYHPSDETSGNYIAVGDMTPVIKVWDLDVIDVLEPEYKLGNKIKKKAIKKTSMNKGHSDAVLSLSWNKNKKNILASGSADSTVILWDLQDAKVLNIFNQHTDKVQCLQWHPFKPDLLLSGCIDGSVKLYDCRTPDVESKSWQIDGEIEKVLWNFSQPFNFFCSTDKGFVYNMDVRRSDPIYSFQAHKEEVTGLDMSPQCPNSLLTASMDRTIGIWDVTNEAVLVKKQKLKVESVHTAKVAPDLEFTIAAGGNKESNNLKIINFMEDQDCYEAFKERLQQAPIQVKIEPKGKIQEMEEDAHNPCHPIPKKEKVKRQHKYKQSKNELLGIETNMGTQPFHSKNTTEQKSKQQETKSQKEISETDAMFLRVQPSVSKSTKQQNKFNTIEPKEEDQFLESDVASSLLHSKKKKRCKTKKE